MSLDANSIAQILMMLIIAVMGWLFKSFREEWSSYRDENRRDLHEIRNTLAPVVTKIAVIEAVQKEREHLPSVIAAAVKSTVSAAGLKVS